MAEPLQRKCRNAVAGRGGVVVSRLGSGEQRLVVVASKEEAACLRILEMRQQCVGELARPRHVCLAVASLQGFQQRVEQEGIVVEIGVQPCFAVLVAGQQTPVAP